MTPHPPDSPFTTQRVVSVVLQTGVRASTGLIVLGTLIWVVGTPGMWTDPHLLAQLLTRDRPADADTPARLAGGIIAAGLLLLILTPVLRVVLSGLAFWRTGDRAFARLSAAVLMLLAFSVVIGALWRWTSA